MAGQPILNEEDAASIDAEYADRMRSLLSVDDMVRELHAVLEAAGEWDNTFVIFSSAHLPRLVLLPATAPSTTALTGPLLPGDHGYSLGEYRLPTHKMQVYENTLRVPFFVKGPGIEPGLQLPIVAGFVDLCPTIVELVSGTAPSDTDGRSFAPFLVPALPKPAKPWKTVHLTTYQSINKQQCLWSENGTNPCGRHPVDARANTHSSIRIHNATTNLLYAEFADVFDPKAWNFEADIEFFALFDMDLDPFQLHNVYGGASAARKAELHEELLRANHCRGQGGVPGRPACP